MNGGYTQGDVEELARVFTGWTLCKKASGELDDPLAACHVYYEEEPAGEIVTTFYEPSHDCLPKELFFGTPEQIEIPAELRQPPPHPWPSWTSPWTPLRRIRRRAIHQREDPAALRDRLADRDDDRRPGGGVG